MNTRILILCLAICGLGSLAFAAAPTLSTVTPSSGISGTKVTLHGSNFTGATAVQLNGSPVADFTVVSAYYITFLVPADSGASSGPVTVITADGKVTSTTNFTVLHPPTITSLSASSIGIGQSMTLTGTNFTAATAVKFNGTAAASFLVSSATSIIATVAGGTTGGKVTVTTPDGTATSAASYTIIPAPTTASFSPTSAVAGTKITLHGSNYTGATGVSFGGTPAVTFTVVSANYITALVPVGALSGPISVTTPGGNVGSVMDFTVLFLPTITGLSATSIGIGQSMTVTGTNFTGATSVKFNGTAAASYLVMSPTSIVAVVASGTTGGKVTVTTSGGTATSTTTYAIIPPPVTLSFSPVSGSIGMKVTLHGTNYTGTTDVSFNGKPATFTFISDSYLTALVPSGATTGKISVTTPGGTVNSATDFSLVPAPVIATISPSTGPIGQSVTVTGTGLDGATGVKFNGVAATSVQVLSGTSITATVPAGATSGAVTVTTPGGTASSPTSFKVLFTPIVISFHPDSASVGSKITLYGNNFTGTTSVDFFNATATNFTVLSDLYIVVYVPDGALSGPISVTNPAGTGSSATSLTLPTPLESYYPFVTGRTWNFHDNITGKTQYLVCTGPTTWAGKACYALTRTIDSQVMITYENWTANGLEEYGYVDQRVMPATTTTFTPSPDIVIPTDITAGRQWTENLAQTSTIPGESYPFSLAETIVGITTVTVDAGTFTNALEIRFTLNILGTNYTTTTFWFVPGIGMVKAQSMVISSGKLSSDIELQSYTR